MTTNESALFCDVCQTRDLNKSAEEYCHQCEETLCRECRDHHKISKLLKSHQTISIEKYRKLPSFIKEIKHNCEEHDCFLEFYCKSHESLCCKLCLISGHKKCNDTIFIENFLTPSSGHPSAALDNIERVLKDLESNICSAIKDRNRNLTELREQKRVIAEQIKEKREEMNTLLDRLEGELLQKASAMETEYCRKIEEVIEKLEDEKKKVDEIQKDIEFVKMSASSLQVFMGTKAFEKTLSTNEINVQMLYNNGSFNNLVLECSLNDNLDGLIREIKTFGDMKVDDREKHVSFSWKRDKSAQIFNPMSRTKSIGNLSVRLVRKIYLDQNCFSGCAMSEAGNMFFLPLYQNKLLKYDPNGQFCSESRISHLDMLKISIGYDLDVLDSNTVAVSSGGNCPQKICLIDMDSTETRQEFELDDWCHGISYHNGSFIFCTYDNGIKMIDRSHGNLTNVRNLSNAPKRVDGTYITSNEDGIFHSNWHDDSVVRYDFHGQVQWKFYNSLVKKPYGITLDSYSNIYVAGSESNNIVVISPDGKQHKELIGASDGLLDPRAIYFDKAKNLLLVANYSGGAFLFEVYNI